MNTWRSSSINFPEKLKVSRNQHGAYHCKDHSTYITNPQLFHQETTNYARIEEKKNHQPNFNPSNLTQFGMELHDSKLNIISIQRLTTIAQEFYELEGLILWPLKEAELELMESGLAMLKQSSYDACTSVWEEDWGLIVLDSSRICICHGWTQASSCFNLAPILLILASNMLHDASRWWIDQENVKLCEEIERKFWEKISRVWI